MAIELMDLKLLVGGQELDFEHVVNGREANVEVDVTATTRIEAEHLPESGALWLRLYFAPGMGGESRLSLFLDKKTEDRLRRVLNEVPDHSGKGPGVVCVSEGRGSKWENNELQFARLLCEIVANIEATGHDLRALCESMDLSETHVDELFVRAHRVWERAQKRGTK